MCPVRPETCIPLLKRVIITEIIDVYNIYWKKHVTAAENENKGWIYIICKKYTIMKKKKTLLRITDYKKHSEQNNHFVMTRSENEQNKHRAIQ